MTKGPTNHAASVRARLLERFRQDGGTFDFLLRRFAGERFLYRLGESPYRRELVLKGASLYALWGGSLYRPTRDLDFTGYGASERDAVAARVRGICEVPLPEDGLEFDLSSLSLEPIREEADYDGLRIDLRARLEAARIPIRIDIGFGNRIEPGPADVEYPTLLNLPAPRIRAYPQEAVIAEKLHAMVTHGERNTRFKDFYDLYALAQGFPFEGRRLAVAIAATFEQRRTPINGTPVALTPRFYAEGARSEGWRTYVGKNGIPGAPMDFSAIGELLAAFLIPAWNALASGERFEASWSPSGPWLHSSDPRGSAQ